MKEKTRLNKLREGFAILKEAGCIVNIIGDSINIEIVTNDISIIYNSGEPIKAVIKDEDTEIDLTEFMKLNTLHFVSGMPVVRCEMFPEKLIQYPDNVKVRYGE